MNLLILRGVTASRLLYVDTRFRDVVELEMVGFALAGLVLGWPTGLGSVPAAGLSVGMLSLLPR